jgi:hypothetical protein
MTRFGRTSVLLALAVVVALSGCAGVGDDPAATGTDGPATPATTDATTAGGVGSPGDTPDDQTTTAGGDATTVDTTTAEPTTAAPGTTTPPPTSANATARFVEGDETLATVSLEVADNDSERAEGLMYRESLASDHGMVFVYDRPQSLSFWMKNTLIPLDMIFVAANGTVLNVEHADVPAENSTDYGSYTSDGFAQYVVEVNRGFANRTGVGPGTEVEFSGLNGTDD